AVGSTVRSTLFLVVASKANYNLLLGREWIHGVGAVSSTLHQKGFAYTPANNVYHSVKLDPTHGFICEREEIDDGPYEEEDKVCPTVWDIDEHYYD
ncbi:hypothetical protein A2U01_0049807, partial [Trifolium medium]|nr:hypothetical protein [Trifolium medium]